MSCSSCNCNPCNCCSCDAANEPLASALDNFISSFYGTVTKTCVNNRVIWTLPCDLEGTPIPDFPRLPGEGLACYFARVFTNFTNKYISPDVPVGVIDGANATFILNQLPVVDPLNKPAVYLNGLLQQEGVDFTRVAQTLTFAVPPPLFSVVLANYFYQ